MTAQKQTWVLLRGWGRSQGHWLDFPELFATGKNTAKEVICVDLPGMGNDNLGTSPATIVEIRKALAKVIDQNERLKEPFYILGISLGGMVALDWALNDPDRIKGVVIINSSVASQSKFYERLKLNNLTTLFRIAREKELIKKEELILSMLSNFPGLQSDIGKRWARVSAEKTPKVSNLLVQLFAAATYNPPPLELKTPGLVLVAEGDRFVDPKCSYKIAEKYNLPLKQHSWGGHEISLDDPLWIINSVEDWLQSIKA